MNKNQKIAVLAIFSVACIIRFYNYNELRYSHDELSALNRIGYPSFSKLIAKGVKIDGHPAGVQVFLHYYSKYFGLEETVMKLPFTLINIASILLVTAIARDLKNLNSGLVAAALMAVMQHSISYAHLIRPYGFGLFFSLLAGFFWVRFFYKKQKIGVLIGFSISAAAAAYSHQFSLLLIALMGLSGFFKVEKKQTLRYFLSCLGIFILYLPHLGIFFYQLSLGGIGEWLKKPSWFFLFKYFGYTFHYSWLFALCFLVCALLFFRIKKHGKTNFLEGIIWFVLTFLIGFVYSVLVNPVLQFSAMLFAFPFLLLSVLSYFRIQKVEIVTLLILGFGTFSLYSNRRYYPLGYTSPFAHSVETLAKAENTQSVLIHNMDDFRLDFYAQKHHIPPERILSFSNKSEFKALISKVLNTNANEVFVAASDGYPNEFTFYLKQWFPYIRKSENFFNLSLYHFSKKAQSEALEILLQVEPIQSQAHADSNLLFAKGFQFELPTKLQYHQEDFFSSEWEISSASEFKQTVIAAGIYQGDSLVNWQETKLSSFQNGSRFNAFHTFSIPKAYLNKPKLSTRVFIYNLDHQNFDYKPKELLLIKGNRLKYGSVQAINKNL